MSRGKSGDFSECRVRTPSWEEDSRSSCDPPLEFSIVKVKERNRARRCMLEGQTRNLVRVWRDTAGRHRRRIWVRVIKESGERLDGSSLGAFHKVRRKQERPERKGQNTSVDDSIGHCKEKSKRVASKLQNVWQFQMEFSKVYYNF